MMLTAILSSVAGSVAGYLLKAFLAGKVITEYERAHAWLIHELTLAKTELSMAKAALTSKVKL